MYIYIYICICVIECALARTIIWLRCGTGHTMLLNAMIAVLHALEYTV